MFFIVNQDGITCAKDESFEAAKQKALTMKSELGENFNIFKYEMVWSTSTLEEAINKE